MDKFSKKAQKQEKRRGPMMCAVPNCPNYGTMSESVHHDSAENAKWYCRPHWAVKEPGQHLERMAVVHEIEIGKHKQSTQHWSDRECEFRMKQMQPADVAAARAFLRQLSGARDPSAVHVEREKERAKSLMRSEMESEE